MLNPKLEGEVLVWAALRFGNRYVCQIGSGSCISRHEALETVLGGYCVRYLQEMIV